ncbi:MAG: translation initiation factor IF-3 [Armatimonadetes bacterium]|nr:translation initiation factor IF-3 [Armatimonadota bacterium]
MNERIRAREIRVIGPDGAQLGIMAPRDALRLAQEQGLDLVEIAPTAQPPVCKIMDFGRYKYEESKHTREAQKKARHVEVKGMRMSPKIGEHDFQVKARHVQRFLQEGNKVKVSMWFRGREMAHPKVGELLLRRMAEIVADVGTMERNPQFEGRNMVMIITPKKGSGGAGSSPAPA